MPYAELEMASCCSEGQELHHGIQTSLCVSEKLTAWLY